MTRTATIFVLLAAATFGGAQAAEDGGEDADACGSDIHRLCEHFLPDDKLVATCLVDQRTRLSRACAEILARPGRD